MHVVLDFDGTITVQDTIHSLANFAVDYKEKSSNDGSPDDDKACRASSSSSSWAGLWKKIVDDYVAEHRAHSEGYQPPAHARDTLLHELTYLRSLRAVDRRSMEAICAAGLFAGLAPLPGRLLEAGRQAVMSSGDVSLRRGFSAFLSETAARRWPVSVVSVNWSDAWIRGVLEGARQTGETSSKEGQAVDGIRIFANTITETGDIAPNFSRKDGKDEGEPIATCSDKLEAMETAVRLAGSGDDGLVYIGDSTTDLECLVQARGGGIIMAGENRPENSGLLKTLIRLGYDVPHVFSAPKFSSRKSREDKDSPARLAWARNFEEVLSSRVLDGL